MTRNWLLKSEPVFRSVRDTFLSIVGIKFSPVMKKKWKNPFPTKVGMEEVLLLWQRTDVKAVVRVLCLPDPKITT